MIMAEMKKSLKSAGESFIAVFEGSVLEAKLIPSEVRRG